MDELATDSDIYSKELKDFCPEVANDRLFVYASNHNLVVLLDTSGREEKTGPEARVKVKILRPIPNPRRELEKLVDCEDIKRRMDELAEAYQQRDPQTWGNARFIGNLLDRIYIQHARRCVRERPTEKGMLTPDDICQIEVPKPRPSIGFAISR